jgi:two-component system response regulator YesN
MIKLMLVDDEPLVLVGLQSMLKWQDYNIEICGCAHNGEEALAMIEKTSPDIVIADLKMPLKSGIEVMKICSEKYGRLPLFIILTSFEEFHLAKEVIKYQAVDYIVKLELTPEELAKSLKKAIQILAMIKPKDELAYTAPEGPNGMQTFCDKFFIKLLNNLFEDHEQYLMQRNELNLDFSFPAYVACYCEISFLNNDGMCTRELMRLYSSTIRMVRETVVKYLSCYIISLDTRHFAIIFCLKEQEVTGCRSLLEDVLKKATTIVQNYFSVQLRCAVGTVAEDPYRLYESFYASRLVFPAVDDEHAILFADTNSSPKSSADVFDISLYKCEITKAYEEMDVEALKSLITKIAGYFQENPSHYVQAMDAACTLLYMGISLLPDGEETIYQIFSDEPDGFLSIHQKRRTAEIVSWMLKLRDGLCASLQNRRQNYKNRLVNNVKKYICENLDRKLSLNEISAHFGFSPNYLSQLFTHYAGCSFVEFVTHEKIAAAKKVMDGDNHKIYEIAEKFGFDNEFYFSKVFKKVEGCSPREYMKRT